MKYCQIIYFFNPILFIFKILSLSFHMSYNIETKLNSYLLTKYSLMCLNNIFKWALFFVFLTGATHIGGSTRGWLSGHGVLWPEVGEVGSSRRRRGEAGQGAARLEARGELRHLRCTHSVNMWMSWRVLRCVWLEIWGHKDGKHSGVDRRHCLTDDEIATQLTNLSPRLV